LLALVSRAFTETKKAGEAGQTLARGPLSTPSTPRSTAKDAAKEHLDAAVRHAAEERHAEAFDAFAKAIAADPSDPRPYIGMGDSCRALDYDLRAGESYRKALQVDPRNSAAKVSLAILLCDLGKNEEAIGLLEELEKEKPGDPFIWAEIAINAIHLGNPRRAVGLLERYNATQGRQTWGFENLGHAYAEAGDDEKAERAYREALDTNPRTALANLWLGQLLVREGRASDAEPFLKAFRQLRELQTQARTLEQGINRNARDVNTLVRLAHVRTLLGQEAQALIPLERALQLAPDDERIRRLYDGVRKSVEAKATQTMPPTGASPAGNPP
jgi:Tfp pilus assembly protein PilF